MALSKCSTTHILILASPLLIGLGIVSILVDPPHAAKPETKKKPDQGSSPSPPLGLDYETYHFRTSGENSCLGEDDYLRWKATGSLEPGKSFSFTPRYPGCQYHAEAISVVLSWEGSELELSSQVPDNDYASWDSSQQGQ